MAHRKAGGTAKNLRDSNPKYLGVKLADGQFAQVGSIIVRQRGTKIMAGANVGLGKDHTLFALADGIVSFGTKRKKHFDGTTVVKKTVSLILDAPTAPAPKKKAAKKTAAKTSPKSNEKGDDLTKIEGIGPVIAKTLAAGGIDTFAKLAKAKDEDVQEMIKDVRGNHEAGTWNEQAALAAADKWDELKDLQDKLNGGKEA